MSFRIQLRRDISENWNDTNPVLAEGEIGLETDTGLFKIGDGYTHWNQLEYYGSQYFALKHHTHTISDINIDSDKSWNNKAITDISTLQATTTETNRINLHHNSNEYSIYTTSDGLAINVQDENKVLLNENSIYSSIPIQANDFYIRKGSITINANTSLKLHLLKRLIDNNNISCYATYMLQWQGQTNKSNNGYILFTVAANNHEDYDATLNILSSVYNGFNPLSLLSLSFSETTNPYESYVDLVIDNTSSEKFDITVKLLNYIQGYYDIDFTHFTTQPLTTLNTISLHDKPDFCLTNEQNRNISVSKGKLFVNNSITIGPDVKVGNYKYSLKTNNNIVLHKQTTSNISCLFANNNQVVSQVTSLYNNKTKKQELHLWNSDKIVLEVGGSENLQNTIQVQFETDGKLKAPSFQPYGSYYSSNGLAGVTKNIDVRLTNFSTATLKFVDGILVGVQIHNGFSSSSSSSSSLGPKPSSSVSSAIS